MQSTSGTSPEPGERRQLDHPPSDRYRDALPAADAGGGTTGAAAAAVETIPDRERVLRGVAGGLVGAIAMTLLGGPLSVTAGLAAAAGVIGWIVGRVCRPLRPAAVVIALLSVWAGLVGIWIYAGIEGGALGLVDYLAQVQGVLVPIELVVAVLLAYLAAGD